MRLLYAATCLLSCEALEELIGVSPDKLHLYRGDKLFCPGNPERKLTPSMLNDGFCDCPEDGFDEPGTSACNNGQFYCKNEGFIPKVIDSIFVGDGVCDCCDGSDEVSNLTVKCPNTCAEMKLEHDRLEKEREELVMKASISKAKLIQDAIDLRKVHHQRVEKARQEIQINENQLNILKNIGGKKEVKEEQTEENQLFTELQSKYEKIKDIFEEMRDSKGKCHAAEAAIQRFESIEKHPEEEPIRTGNVLFDDLLKDGEIAEERQKTLWESLKSLDFKELRALFRQYRVTKTVTVMVSQRKLGYVRSWSSPCVATKVVESNPVLEMEMKLIELKNSLGELEKKYEKDYGPKDIFLPLQEQCFEAAHDKYVYKLCMFSKVTQSEFKDANNQNMDLGQWKGWAEDSEGKPDYSQMIYDGGMFCWNGPRRNTKVLLECGDETRILEVSEPSTCTYVMRVSTPAVC